MKNINIENEIINMGDYISRCHNVTDLKMAYAENEVRDNIQEIVETAIQNRFYEHLNAA